MNATAQICRARRADHSGCRVGIAAAAFIAANNADATMCRIRGRQTQTVYGRQRYHSGRLAEKRATKGKGDIAVIHTGCRNRKPTRLSTSEV